MSWKEASSFPAILPTLSIYSGCNEQDRLEIRREASGWGQPGKEENVGIRNEPDLGLRPQGDQQAPS